MTVTSHQGDDAFETAPPIEDAAGCRILIHAGPHKTATTWLQKSFFPNVSGIVFCDDRHLTRPAFLLPRFGEFDTRRVRDLFLPLLRRAASEERVLVISDEALGGAPFHQKHVRRIVAERLHSAFPEAHVLVSTREQAAVIYSMYGEYLRFGYSSTLTGFLDQEPGTPLFEPLLDLDYYEWDRTLGIYEDVFGHGRVSAVPMEMFAASPADFARLLSERLDAPIALPADGLVAAPERPASSGWSRGTLRFLNQFRPQDTRWRHSTGRLAPNSVAYHVDRFTPTGIGRKAKARDMTLIREALGDRFRASNRRFAERTGFDAARLGYAS